MEHLTRKVEWQPGNDSRTTWTAIVDGQRWQIMPEDGDRYSLLVDGVVVEQFFTWPACWSRPAATLQEPEDDESGEDLYLKRNYELEMERLEYWKSIGPSPLVEKPHPRAEEALADDAGE